MSKRGEDRREKILDVAQASILQKGFSATSIEEILEKAHITKGGFFYHFPGKSELARALVERYLRDDMVFFDTLERRARELSDDPLQQMLLFINLLAEAMENLEDVHPGCLVASFTYESQLLDEDIKALIATGTLQWREKFAGMLARIEESHRANLEVDHDEVADMLSATIEGGIILSRVMADKALLVQQLKQYRNYIKLMYTPAAGVLA
ncbi:TetR/AcrR family transcriptional regulator [Mangrovimicrobium sediminis]|uniref:TetR/AcrR family transcriptional regulator n=1 Tax=Mangrovimicrobium sediminis TaxID=2562682 RepID=A0A4Z0LX97_9GAMM|nr:TetR/AcrR family transcriptional regulator [Haliea sp. SAOS-164]TGD71786.1 TetR/AcrR family transcriptional regulator [Haliea sp. SAOS-164]